MDAVDVSDLPLPEALIIFVSRCYDLCVFFDNGPVTFSHPSVCKAVASSDHCALYVV